MATRRWSESRTRKPVRRLLLAMCAGLTVACASSTEPSSAPAINLSRFPVLPNIGGHVRTLMSSLRRTIALLWLTVGLAPMVGAQEAPGQIRFTTSGAGEAVHWQGDFVRLTPDSLQIRVRGADTLAAFSRVVVRGVEREDAAQPGKAAGVGCLFVGAILGAVGYFATHDQDAPGLDRAAGVLGAVVGCGVGAIGGLIGSAVTERRWEPWPLPDSMPSTEPPN